MRFVKRFVMMQHRRKNSLGRCSGRTCTLWGGKKLGVIYSENLLSAPQHTKCTPRQSNKESILGLFRDSDVGAWFIYVVVVVRSFEGDD